MDALGELVVFIGCLIIHETSSVYIMKMSSGNNMFGTYFSKSTLTLHFIQAVNLRLLIIHQINSQTSYISWADQSPNVFLIIPIISSVSYI